ncbi:MAG: hypothetical protein LBJ38_01115 [Oscillospiraceae bacterium]|nr:hypothetical protein [Oscillospiraceae bacterium]
MEDVCVSLIDSDNLLLVPILFSVFRSFEVLKKGEISTKSFYFWYALCLVLCTSYKFSVYSGDLHGVFPVIFEAASQGLLLGSFILNFKDVKGILKKKWGNRNAEQCGDLGGSDTGGN